MQLEVRFLCPELVGKVNSGIYTVADGATIRDLVAVCLRESDVVLEEGFEKWLVFLADGKPATWDTKLDRIKKVHVLRAVLGG